MKSSKQNVFCGQSHIEINKESNQQDVKLFKIKLADYLEIISNLKAFLTIDEVERAERYHFLKDKNRFIICRGLLRLLLSHQLKINASKIIFKKDTNKKPYLPTHRSINFNVSHSEGYAIIAIGTVAVGVDVEYINRKFDFSDILNQVFSDNEKSIIENSANKKIAFYNLWTRKEAFVKATGKGITDNFSQIPSLNGSHFVSPSLLGSCKNLNVLSFELDEDYAAAVAFSGKYVQTDKISIYSLPTTFKQLLLLNRQ